MPLVDTVIIAAATVTSGSAVVGAKALLDLRNDARTAMRILTGREEMDADGLVHVVEELQTEVNSNARAIAELAHQNRTRGGDK